MQPSDNQIGPGTPSPSSPPSTPNSTGNSQTTQDAAVSIVRDQIDNIFNQQNGAQPQAGQQPQTAPRPAVLRAQPQPRPQLQPRPRTQAPAQVETPKPAEQPQPQTGKQTDANTNPYDRTHTRDQTRVQQTDHWKYYHSAWQDYYRQYYERYYIGEVYRMRQDASSQGGIIPLAQAIENSKEEEDAHEAFHDLRDDLLQNIRTSAKRVHKSRHFMPIMAAMITIVMFWFVGVGGNKIVIGGIKAYASPGSINPTNIVVDPTLSPQVGDEPRLIIPKINVDTPIIYDTKPDRQSQLNAMERGVAWFGIPGASSQPGQVGNTVLSGHSSNDLFDPGEFKFIFARLEHLVEGDVFYINHQGIRYTYSVTKREVVRPNEVNKLVYPTEKPIVTLITCVPVGTARDRLLVTAEQISPDPSQAKEAPTTTEAESAAMPGNSPTLLSRLFGSGGN